MKISFPVPSNFDFWRTVYSHGWCELPPFSVDKENHRFHRILRLKNDKLVLVILSDEVNGRLTIEVEGIKLLTRPYREEIRMQIQSCFRLNEDYSEFYSEARRHKQFQWVPKIGAGRLLRTPTVFEDVVKMICTTNCSWALTEIMVENLCNKLGLKFQDSSPNDVGGQASFTFPKPEAIADCSEKFLRKEIRAGYRAPYLLELSRRIVKEELDLGSWRTLNVSTEELYQLVRSVKGIGPYAAGNILKLLGRYDYLGIDSWCRKKFFELHKNGRKTSDKVIEKFYEPFGKWKGLFFWMDLTKYWYDQKFPF